MKILITEEHVLAAIKENSLPTNSCAMHQALRPFIKGNFGVISSEAFTDEDVFYFDIGLPDELYAGRYDEALAHIEKHGPYEFEVSGL